MKTLVSLTLLAMLIPALAADDSKAAVKSAAKKLADQPNYSWTATTKSESSQRFRMGPLEGKAEKDGWVFTSTTFNDATIESVYKGDKAATKREDEWQTIADLESGDTAWMARLLKGFKTPPTEVMDLADKTKDLKKGDDGVHAGHLTLEGAQSLLTRRSRPDATPPADAKGTVKFWIKDGLLTRYEYFVEGTIARQNGEETKTDRTTTVEFKNVGTTKVEVPAEVKKKLS